MSTKQTTTSLFYLFLLPSLKIFPKKSKNTKKILWFQSILLANWTIFFFDAIEQISFFFNCDPKGVSVGWWYWWLSLLPPPHTTRACIKVPLIATSKYGDTRYGRIILPCNRLQTTTPKVLGS